MTLLCTFKNSYCRLSMFSNRSKQLGNTFWAWRDTDGSTLPMDGSWGMAHRLLSKVILNNCTYLAIYNTGIGPVTSCVRHFAKLLHVLQTDGYIFTFLFLCSVEQIAIQAYNFSLLCQQAGTRAARVYTITFFFTDGLGVPTRIV